MGVGDGYFSRAAGMEPAACRVKKFQVGEMFFKNICRERLDQMNRGFGGLVVCPSHLSSSSFFGARVEWLLK